MSAEMIATYLVRCYFCLGEYMERCGLLKAQYVVSVARGFSVKAKQKM